MKCKCFCNKHMQKCLITNIFCQMYYYHSFGYTFLRLYEEKLNQKSGRTTAHKMVKGFSLLLFKLRLMWSSRVMILFFYVILSRLDQNWRNIAYTTNHTNVNLPIVIIIFSINHRFHFSLSNYYTFISMLILCII